MNFFQDVCHFFIVERVDILWGVVIWCNCTNNSIL